MQNYFYQLYDRCKYNKIILQNFEDLFPSSFLKEEVINTMQIGFNAWQDILKSKDKNEYYYSFYFFFMFGAFFIVLKVKHIYIYIFKSY